MQKCKCKWCGDEFLGGPTRIRAHHVKPIVESGQADKKYKICTSKANAALAFKAKYKEAIDERQLAKVKKTEQAEAEKKHTIVAAFVKEHHIDETRAAIEGAGFKIEQELTRGRWTTFVGTP